MRWLEVFCARLDELRDVLEMDCGLLRVLLHLWSLSCVGHTPSDRL